MLKGCDGKVCCESLKAKKGGFIMLLKRIAYRIYINS